MSLRAVDANILLRHVTGDHSQMSPASGALLQRVNAGEEEIFLPEAALADTLWTLRSHYRWTVDAIYAFAGDLLAMDGVQMSRKDLVWEALVLYQTRKLDFSDALIAAEMASAGLTEIYSYDKDFDRLPALVRIEP